MKINNDTNTIFTGYKNVLTLNAVDSSRRLTFLSAQITNEYANHLDKLKELKKLLPRKAISDDTFTLLYIKDGSDATERLFLDSYEVTMPSKLKELYKKAKHSEIEKSEFKTKEKITLKAFSLFSDLTQMILACGVNNNDNEIQKVLNMALSTIQNILPPKSSTLILMQSTIRNDQNKVAEFFNRNIRKTMKVYFKD